MANLTKISPYRTGAPRFGLKGHKFDNSVKISYLSPEELEEYRSGKKGGSKLFTYDDYQKMKNEGKSRAEIAKEMKISVATLYNRLKVWKGQPLNDQTLKATETKVVVEKKVDSKHVQSDKTSEYETLIAELKGKLDSSEHGNKVRIEVIKELESKITELENIAAACEDVENETARLQEENKNLQEKLLNSENRLQQSYDFFAQLQSDYNELQDDFYSLKEEIEPLRKLTMIKLRTDLGVLD